MRKTHMMLVLLGVFILLGTSISSCSAEILPYNKIYSSAADLPQTQAVLCAIDYYNQHTAREFLDNDSSFRGIEMVSGRYFLNSSLIRFFHESKEYYGWVISFFDKERAAIRSLDYYIGTVIVDSLSAQILFFSDREFIVDCEKLGNFMDLIEYDINSIIKIIEPLIFPSDTFGMKVFPSIYDISKDEAESLAYEWIAREESIPTEEARKEYQANSLLVQYPGIVTEHIWRIYFAQEGRSVSEYQIGVYASHGAVWFASKRNPELASEYFYHKYSFLYVNNEYCCQKIIDVTTLPYGDWGGWIDCIFGMDIPESDYIVPYITNE